PTTVSATPSGTPPMTLKDFITKAATDHAVARNADAKLVAAEAARIAARDEDSAALAAETASTARLAAALPSGSALPAARPTAFPPEHPLCNRCPADRPAAARDVHHVKPRDVRPDLAFDPDNLEGLCVACHKRTRDEDRKQRRTA